ncbi:MAG: hypothetical protein AB7F74_22765 [Parvibaculaceae bacterium]
MDQVGIEKRIAEIESDIAETEKTLAVTHSSDPAFWKLDRHVAEQKKRLGPLREAAGKARDADLLNPPPRHVVKSPKAASISDVNKAIEEIDEAFLLMKEYVDKKDAEISDRLKAIETKSFPYRGVYQASEIYRRGDFVTLQGSMWHCTRDTQNKPGASDDWQLAVKAGRDGKDPK